MKNLVLVMVCSIFISSNAVAVQPNNTVAQPSTITELSKEIQQLYHFALKKDVSMSTKRNIVCQYLPNRLEKFNDHSVEQQKLNVIAKNVGKIKDDLNIQCAG